MYYNLKIIKCGERIEIYKINNYAINEGSKIIEDNILEDLSGVEEEKTDKPSTIKKDSKQIRKETLTKARNNIIRLIKCNADMNTFITLTFKEQQDYKESKKHLNILFTKLRRDYSSLKYLWVLEYGDTNKRLHYHLLCNIPISIKLSDSKHKKSGEHKALEQEFASRYWNHGFVDIRQLQQEHNTNIALYVSTYIVKSLQDLNLEGYRVYGYSRKTLLKPLEEKIYTKDNLEQILSQFPDHEITFSNSYGIGYTDWRGDHKGTVSYFDLKLKEGVFYED